MASVCFYFQIHQPYRLRRYSVFDTESQYFDDARNLQILAKVVQRCYLPASRLMLELVRKHQGAFRIAYSLTGCILEQLQKHHPDVIEVLRDLAATGCVEFLGETYHHSLAFLYSREEFRSQVRMHADLVKDLFGQRPKVFRNTELIYNNDLANFLHTMGEHTAILAEGHDRILGTRSPNYVYAPPGPAGSKLRLLLKNYRLSDDIAFRFSNRAWSEWPLTADKYARWLARMAGQGVVNLFMDYETFGEHQWSETGIFEFMRALPDEVFKQSRGELQFRTPSEIVASAAVAGEYDVPQMISWADTERDLSAWLGNAMQSNALHELYKLESVILTTGDAALITDWRKLTTSDHFYYMCTKYFSDGDVHKYFNPYESPYDSYINFMNVLDNLRTRVEGVRGIY